MNDQAFRFAEALVAQAQACGLSIATAESCTGGLVAAALTDIPGSSAVFDRGFVTYSDAAKAELLGVPQALLARHGAVSAETAKAMAEGARERAGADIAVSITGIAGPDGGTAEKPVGLVWFGLATADMPARAERRLFAGGSRRFVRIKSVETALALLLAAARAA